MTDGVTPIPGEPGRFWVNSFSCPGVVFVVDLTEFQVPGARPKKYNGSCTCENFQFKRLARLLRGERGPHLACKHIKAAKEEGWDWLWGQCEEQFERQQNERKATA